MYKGCVLRWPCAKTFVREKNVCRTPKLQHGRWNKLNGGAIRIYRRFNGNGFSAQRFPAITSPRVAPSAAAFEITIFPPPTRVYLHNDTYTFAYYIIIPNIAGVHGAITFRVNTP